MAQSPLLKALIGLDHNTLPLRSWSASLIFMHLFLNNDKCKELVGDTMLKDNPGEIVFLARLSDIH